jgi:hypothetical protein
VHGHHAILAQSGHEGDRLPMTLSLKVHQLAEQKAPALRWVANPFMNAALSRRS